MKILSDKIKLYYATTKPASGGTWSWTNVTDVTSLPAMGATPEKVEVTPLGTDTRQYIQGLRDFGDLEFGFVFDEESGVFEELKALEKSNCYFRVSFPAVSSTSHVLTPDEGLQFYFKGEPSVAMGAVEVGARVDFTMSVALASDIVNDEDDIDF